MDRGYVDFERLYKFTLGSAFFVVRANPMFCCGACSNAVGKTTGDRSDQTVILTAINSAKSISTRAETSQLPR
jgi:hypothetical protein